MNGSGPVEILGTDDVRDDVMEHSAQAFIKQGFDRLLTEKKNIVRAYGIKPIVASGVDYGDLPSRSIHSWIFSRYVVTHMGSNSNRNMKKSDTGNHFHARYLPYVDVSRTDSYFAKFLKEEESKFGTLVAFQCESRPQS